MDIWCYPFGCLSQASITKFPLTLKQNVIPVVFLFLACTFCNNIAQSTEMFSSTVSKLTEKLHVFPQKWFWMPPNHPYSELEVVALIFKSIFSNKLEINWNCLYITDMHRRTLNGRYYSRISNQQIFIEYWLCINSCSYFCVGHSEAYTTVLALN